MIATLTNKGQLTLPIQIRRLFGLEPGDQLDFVVQEDGRIEVYPISTSLKSLKGMVPPPKKAVSLEDMDLAIQKRGKS